MYLVRIIMATVFLTSIAPSLRASDSTVYWTDRHCDPLTFESCLMGANPDGSNPFEVIRSQGNYDGLAIGSDRNSFVLSTDLGIELVSGNPATRKQVAFAVDPDSLVVDALNNRIYFENYSGMTHIERVDIDGSNRMTIIPNASGIINGMAIDPAQDQLFVSRNFKIYRARLDGSDFTPVVYDGSPSTPGQTFSTYGIGVDPFEQKLYWADSYNGDSIRRSNYDGTDVEMVFDDVGFNSHGQLAVDPVNQFIYWYNGFTVRGRSYDGTVNYTHIAISEEIEGIAVAYVPEPAASPLFFAATAALALVYRRSWIPLAA
jgi:sugar lactone lactonase YvrE